MRCASAFLSCALFACGAESPDDELPEALRSQPDGAEVAPFSGWTADGLTLYTVSFAVPDMSSTAVVGVDSGGSSAMSP